MFKTKSLTHKTTITGIYLITSPTGRKYIGQSWDIKSRWRQHKTIKVNSKRSIIRDSFKKYGIENHLFEVLHQLPIDVSQDILNEYEIFYIDLYKSSGYKMMNILDGGRNSKWEPGRKERMKEHLKKLGELSKKRKGSIVAWNKGKTGLTVAWNKDLKGVYSATKETREKISNANKGKQFSLGRKMNEKTRLSLFAANKGSKRSDKVKILMSKLAMGNKKGIANSGKKRTKEMNERNSSAQKKRTKGKGENHPMSKINKGIVIAIREKYIPRKYSSLKLAAEYGLAKSSVLSILQRKTWNYDNM